MLSENWYRGGDFPDPVRDGVGYLGVYLGREDVIYEGSHPDEVLSCSSVSETIEEAEATYGGALTDGYRMRAKSYARNYAGTMEDEFSNRIPLNTSRIELPSQVCTVADGSSFETAIYWRRYNTYLSPESNTWCIPTARHQDKINATFYDGHAKAMTFDELYTSKHMQWNP